MSYQIFLNNKQMHKKLLMDCSPKELFTPNSPGIFVEMLWKPGSDLKSLVSLVSGFLGEDQWTTNPPLVGLGVCSEDRQSEEVSLKQTWVHVHHRNRCVGSRRPTGSVSLTHCQHQVIPVAHVGFNVFPSVFLMGLSWHSPRKFSSRFHCPKICSAVLPTFPY